MNSRSTRVVVMGKCPLRSGSLEDSNRQTLPLLVSVCKQPLSAPEDESQLHFDRKGEEAVFRRDGDLLAKAMEHDIA